MFDSFQGVPDNDEPEQRQVDRDAPVKFRRGDYRAGLEEVRANVARVGSVASCRFVPGWFEETMPAFKDPIVAGYLDVDLASSTRTCLRYLYPLLQPGGALYSQDGHIPLVRAVLKDPRFWTDVVGSQAPPLSSGPWGRKLVKIAKPLE